MSQVTVEKLSKIVGTPVDKLLEQMKDAGVELSGADDVVSDDQKKLLLAHLKKSHGETSETGAVPKKITLKRSTKSSLKLSGSSGKSKTVNVEVRKKRTYVKREETNDSSEVDDNDSVEEMVIVDDAETIAAKEAALEAEKVAAEEQRKKIEEEIMAKAMAAAMAEASQAATDRTDAEVEAMANKMAAEEAVKRAAADKEKQKIEKERNKN